MPHDVMIIDDSDLQRYLTETIVKRNLPVEQIVSFNSPIGALAYLHSIENYSDTFPKVIFLDIHMPLMNGFGFLDKYLEFPEKVREDCKIVMLSSTDSDEDHARMNDYPIIYKFISKPMSDEMTNDICALWETSKTK